MHMGVCLWHLHCGSDLLYTDAVDCLPLDDEKIVDFDRCMLDSPGALNPDFAGARHWEEPRS